MAPKDGLEQPTTKEEPVEPFDVEPFAEDVGRTPIAVSNYEESEEFVTGCYQTLSFVDCRLLSEEILNFFKFITSFRSFLVDEVDKTSKELAEVVASQSKNFGRLHEISPFFARGKSESRHF